MPDSTAFDIEDVITGEQPFVNHIPPDTIVFDATQIGNWEAGYVLASNDATFGAWSIQHSSRIDNPDAFTRERGVWLDDTLLAEWFIEQRSIDEPAQTANKQLTELSDN